MLCQVRQGSRPAVLTDNNPSSVPSSGQPQHLVYLERLKKLRAAGGLADAGNVDQENVENYSKSQNPPPSAYSSGIGINTVLVVLT